MNTMPPFLIIIFIILAVVIYYVQKSSHESRIHDEIGALGGTVIDIQRKTFATGPFVLVGKGRTVYRIEYRIGNEVKEGWVKFGGLMGPDWRL